MSSKISGFCSASVLVLSILVVRSLPLNNLKMKVLRRTPNTDGLLSQLVRVPKSIGVSNALTLDLDTMIDFGFVVAAFVPLVCVWM